VTLIDTPWLVADRFTKNLFVFLFLLPLREEIKRRGE
jgi:hypothetical protein